MKKEKDLIRTTCPICNFDLTTTVVFNRVTAKCNNADNYLVEYYIGLDNTGSNYYECYDLDEWHIINDPQYFSIIMCAGKQMFIRERFKTFPFFQSKEHVQNWLLLR